MDVLSDVKKSGMEETLHCLVVRGRWTNFFGSFILLCIRYRYILLLLANVSVRFNIAQYVLKSDSVSSLDASCYNLYKQGHEFGSHTRYE